ncbi:hypothetical protein HJC23_011191 [Cyclotella cryptica]|uniref:CABIT domain-containing protein n=1 Tax=Cyclotella cryptica TaxID=29204 RepID=A0ABD3PWC1_9STRA|eukprot:CCRYP_010991-RA/>CCRYP_010991-RA protein AED:0.04 eAED:0.18 QI:0/-1/0/1/-1/1/1/0/741
MSEHSDTPPNHTSRWQTPRALHSGKSSNNTTQSNHPPSHTIDDHDHANADEPPETNHLLFSSQCDSAGAIGTLLSCLRRVISKSSHGPAVPTTGHAAIAAVGGGAETKVQHATVYAGPNGLTFHCVQGLARQSQCSVDLPRGLFREYFVGEEEVWLEESEEEGDLDDVDNGSSEAGGGSQRRTRVKEVIRGGEFGINLTTVLECFSILSKNHRPSKGGGVGVGGKHPLGEYASLDKVPLCMSYDRDTALFHLEFLDEGSIGGGCLVTCEVPGVSVDENGDNSGLASAFRSSPLLARAIFYSDALQAAVAELYDVPGASVVEVKFSKKGMELGAVGPRSEVCVSVPYQARPRANGMYVGMEYYSQEEENMAKRYPLGAFLTGMRGLDIGCETCISVSSRGMMAIQHQVSRDGCDSSHGDVVGVRPSFVDFIMTCMEEEVDDEEERPLNESVVNRGDERLGIRDVTNDVSVEEASVRGRHILRKNSQEKRHQHRTNHNQQKELESKEDENDDITFDGDSEADQENSADAENKLRAASATSRILGELEVNEDNMHTSNLGSMSKRRVSALADIRRKRELRRSRTKNDTLDDDHSKAQSESIGTSISDRGRKRRSSASEKQCGSRESDHEQSSVDENDISYSWRKQRMRLDDTPQDTTYDPQSQSDNDDDSEADDSLDVTAEIPQIFSKSSSLRTSRHGSRQSNGEGTSTVEAGCSDEDLELEPRMMYGDTKLEFTQDGYGSDVE